jgi:hypothetical protein
LLEPDSEAVADDEGFDEPPPLKKLLRDHPPPDEPWPPLDEDPRGAQLAPVCGNAGAAIPGALGWQFSPGISA